MDDELKAMLQELLIYKNMDTMLRVLKANKDEKAREEHVVYSIAHYREIDSIQKKILLCEANETK